MGSLQVADLDVGEHSVVHLVTTVALFESEGMGSDAICAAQHCFPVEASCGSPGPFTEGSSS